ncbi:hypothetical protein A8990_11427 [Paenibacillus taihuensis]|uniref:CDP-glycerol:poly(Glycerophosphate) glycerophosphotransferase n=1 Tax=Paenibacillus taihuensis TaxID=1156355 RepID=A0A3D9RWY9_9BACL|nr:hypothetical protein [Paenibacillus taihuensis]REE84493.1 hypothetical protein A8990_11427 [Paenibacillus taihuensis]
MFRSMKTRIFDLLDTVSDMVEEMRTLSDRRGAISDCLGAIEAISAQLEEEETAPGRTVDKLIHLQAMFKDLYAEGAFVNDKSVALLRKLVRDLQTTLRVEIKPKLNVVFFPYKASMWDSLESVYEAAANDPDCVAQVVPIPYYQLSQDGAVPAYEGELFPAHIPVTHFNEYSLEAEQPDIIFVHNIYDQYNTLTRVHEHFFTSNLKQYTDMLVYVPYHVSSFVPPTESDSRLAYDIPGIKNIDKVILVNEFLKQGALRQGVPKEKLLVLGSPKFDALVKAMNNEIDYPIEWVERIQGKRVYLINTPVLMFANNLFNRLETLINFLNIPTVDPNSIVIWRPHPLTQASIKQYSPFFMEYYVRLTSSIRNRDPLYRHIILDESADYIPALKAADVIISNVGSLLRSFLLTEKKVLFWGSSMPEGSLIPNNAFYYAFDEQEPWFDLIKKFSEGYDPLAENRKGMAKKAYVNTDGSSGAKVYQTIKERVLKK